MKRLLLVTVLMILFSQSNAQTSVPFYGFELSNYEVGDTLEYNYTSFVVGVSGGCSGKSLQVILHKQQIAFDTIVYTFKRIQNGYCTGAPFGLEGIDTFSLNITIDSILNNSNNVLQLPLPAMDTLSTGFLVFDTVNGLKHISASIQGFEWSHHYEATQNLGIISLSRTVPFPSSCYTYELLYANLQHYGMYGTYEPIYLTTHQIQQNDFVVNYSSESKTIQVKSNNHLNGLIRLYDVLGRCLLTSNIDDNEFDVDNLTTGFYFYSIQGHQGINGKLFIDNQ